MIGKDARRAPLREEQHSSDVPRYCDDAVRPRAPPSLRGAREDAKTGGDPAVGRCTLRERRDTGGTVCELKSIGLSQKQHLFDDLIHE